MKQSLLTISILGDICPAWGFRKSFDSGDEKEVFGDVLPYLKDADLTIANFECPATESAVPVVKCGPNLKAKPSDLSVLKQAGIQAISLANNHILDYGGNAVLETISFAQKEGIATYGAGGDCLEAAKPCLLERKGKRIGLLAFAEEEFNCVSDHNPGANLFDPYVSLKQIESTRAECDYLIVQYHGGIEHFRYPSPLLQKKCRAMVEVGADLVLCQHSHCIGTYEKYQNATILYGQGNAVFGRIEGNDAWNTGLLVTVTLNEDTASVGFRVFEAKTNGIAFVEEKRNQERLKQMGEESRQLTDPDFIKKQWKTFCEKQRSAYLPAICCWNRVMNKGNRVLKNLLAKFLISQNRERVAMNLIRCEAHREVLQTILEQGVFREP